MKKMITPLVVLALLVGFGNIVSANSIWIGTYPGNDNKNFEADVSSWYSTYFGADWGTDWDIDFYAKVDGSSGSNGGLTISSGPGQLTGTWETLDPINLFSVKASDGYALYWLEPAASLGRWTTEAIVNNGGNQPGISHLSAWTITGYTPPENPVPEPGTLVLFGVGLLGMAGFCRRGQSS